MTTPRNDDITTLEYVNDLVQRERVNAIAYLIQYGIIREDSPAAVKVISTEDLEKWVNKHKKETE